MPSSLQKVHIWMPNLFGFKGGIQVYSAYLLQALQRLLPQAHLHVFLLHDQPSMQPDALYSNVHFHFAGSFPQQTRNLVYATQVTTSAILQQPQLIISTHLNFTPVARAIKQLVHIPYWTVAHGVEAWNIKRANIQRGLQAADCILPVSDYTQKRLLHEQSLQPERLHTLPNTVDTQRFQIRAKPKRLLVKYGLSEDQPVILTVNRLCSTESFKSYDQIITALPGIQNKFSNVRYIVVGKGDDLSRLEKTIRDKQLEKNVTLAGFVADSELCDYYNLCDVFAMPSKLEGFGIVYLEALACGKPVLGGNQDGAVDALCNGKLGALVNPDDSQELVQTLIQMLTKEYSHPLMYQPQLLRQAVIDTYGFDAFEQRLSALLTQASVSLSA